MKRWFITGVSGGLGRALARAALARGDHVSGTVRRDEDQAAFEALGPKARAFLLDVTNHDALGQAIRAAEGEEGLDILVNNAGYGLICPLEEASAAEIRDQFEANVFAPIAAVQAALPGMRERRRGRIINISSVSGLAPWPGTAIYTASKFALEGAMRTLSLEIAPFGLHLINIQPGGIRSAFGAGSMKTAKTTLAAYDGDGRQAERILRGNSGNEAGDPAKMAVAILEMADHPSPPLQLLLGADALHYAAREAGRIQAETGDWAPLSLSTAFV